MACLSGRVRLKYLPASAGTEAMGHAGLGCDTKKFARGLGLGADSVGDVWAHPYGTVLPAGLHERWGW